MPVVLKDSDVYMLRAMSIYLREHDDCLPKRAAARCAYELDDLALRIAATLHMEIVVRVARGEDVSDR